MVDGGLLVVNGGLLVADSGLLVPPSLKLRRPKVDSGLLVPPSLKLGGRRLMVVFFCRSQRLLRDQRAQNSPGSG